MRKNFKGILNLDYIEVKNVPVEKNERLGEIMSAEVSGWVERMAARALLERGVPIRGAEVQFLRGVLGMSQRQLGDLLGYSGVAILKWERGRNRRLDRVNEIAVRALMADRYGIKASQSWETLIGTAEAPKRLVVDYKDYEREFKAAA